MAVLRLLLLGYMSVMQRFKAKLIDALYPKSAIKLKEYMYQMSEAYSIQPVTLVSSENMPQASVIIGARRESRGICYLTSNALPLTPILKSRYKQVTPFFHLRTGHEALSRYHAKTQSTRQHAKMPHHQPTAYPFHMHTPFQRPLI